ncbi:MAG TPA: SpoIID/LytB domain-containing protein [Symbiobacteriaceae bacterium]|nr:SpoIID/LytB domain-containing protein [Symbiobacteriaceae bacterium]
MALFRRLMALTASALVLAMSFAPAYADPDQVDPEEALMQFKEEYGESHAAVGYNKLAPDDKHQIGNPKAPVYTIRVGLRYSWTPTGGFSEFYSYNHPRVQLTGTVGTFNVVDRATGNVLATANAGEVFTVNHNGTGFVVVGPDGAEVATVAGPVGFTADDPENTFKVPSIQRTNVITWVGRVTPEYRGEMEIARGKSTPAGQVNLVNIVELETYLRGNVVNESPASFHREALAAQAIVARGYAIANIGRFAASYPFDIDDSPGSQVYRGKTSEHPNGDAAVAETEGLTVTYGGKIISAFYSSSMGGYTENVEWSFSGTGEASLAQPHLKGRYDGPEGTEPDLSTEEGLRAFWANDQPQVYDSKALSGNPRNRWTYTLTRQTLETKINALGSAKVVISGSKTSIGTLQKIDVIQRSPSGRAVIVRITGNAAVWEVRNWGNVRTFTPHPSWGTLDNPVFYDHNYNADGSLASVTIIGGAWGHNVGMSQYGANGRGKSGQTVDEILAFYYKDTAIVSYPVDIDRDPSVSPRVWRQKFASPGGVGILEIRPDLTKGRMEGMNIEVNGSKTIHLTKADLSQELFTLDVSEYMQVGENVVDFKILGNDGAATVQLRVSK